MAVHLFCRPLSDRFVRLAVLTGELPARDIGRNPEAYLGCEWLPPKFDYVDTIKDVQAEIMAIGAGLKSRSDCPRACAELRRQFPTLKRCRLVERPDLPFQSGRKWQWIEDHVGLLVGPPMPRDYLGPGAYDDFTDVSTVSAERKLPKSAV